MNKYFNLILVIFCFQIFTIASLSAQTDSSWDKIAESNWSKDFQKVEIPSTEDGKIQKAYLYATKSKIPQPLIISLHTWSGNYAQKDHIANECLGRNWNYIHPDFRGPNNTPESMGSKFVISDLQDAIEYALKHTNSDPKDVHIVGTSGGGFATLVAYMNIKYPVKSFSAWVPMPNLVAWYWESIGREYRYANEIFKAVSSSDSTFNSEEARRRSPLFQKYPQGLRRNAKLYIYTGSHDGYKGAVPITQSIDMYNRLVGELKYGLSDLDQIVPRAATDSSLVSYKEMISLVTKQMNPSYNKSETLFGRNIYLSREYKNIHLTVFDGGHEQLPQALELIPVNKDTSLTY